MTRFIFLLLTILSATLQGQDTKIGTDTKSVSKRVEIPYVSSHKPTIWVLAIGISRYSEDAKYDFALPDLHSPANNAQEFARLFERTGMVKEKITVLTDAKATKVSIKKAFDNLFVNNNRIKEDDLVVFYFSGHGGYNSNNNTSAIYPFDCYNKDMVITESYIKGKMDLSNVKHKLCFIESCKCELVSMGGGFTFSEEEKAVANNARSEVEDGWVYMTSTEVGKVSYDRREGSVFSKYLLKGLEGAANNDGSYINAENLFSYIKVNVEKETKSYGKGVQVPMINKNYLKKLPIIPIKK
jgi:hypothetical protein